MITTGTPDSISIIVQPDVTSRLAAMAAQAGVSTVEMASRILADSIQKEFSKKTKTKKAA